MESRPGRWRITTICRKPWLWAAPRRRPTRVRFPICLLCSAALWPAADHLPDMRWVFERALRLDARGDVHRFDRVRAWAMIPLLYPDDEPRTENDDVWRVIARAALHRLDASAAGYPPPQAPLLPPVVPADPLRELLGISLGSAPAGGLLVREVTRASSGLRPGDRILRIAGAEVLSQQDAARLVAMAGGRIDLALDGGRELSVLIGADRPAPLLAALIVRNEVAAWQDTWRWMLPPIDGAWLVAGHYDPILAITVDGRAQRPPPGATGWTTITPSGPCVVARRGLGSGAFSLRAVPLRGTWRTLALEASWVRHRLVLGVRAGQALVIESDGAPHRLEVRGPGGDLWSDQGEATSQRIIRHGPAGAMAEAAIECNGMVEVTVRPSGFPASVRLRILSELPTGATGP